MNGMDEMAESEEDEHEGVNNTNSLVLGGSVVGQLGLDEGIGSSNGVDAGIAEESDNESLRLVLRHVPRYIIYLYPLFNKLISSE